MDDDVEGEADPADDVTGRPEVPAAGMVGTGDGTVMGDADDSADEVSGVAAGASGRAAGGASGTPAEGPCTAVGAPPAPDVPGLAEPSGSGSSAGPACWVPAPARAAGEEAACGAAGEDDAGR